MADKERIKKIDALIQRELGNLILREIDLPPGLLVTITNVTTAFDLSESKIAISVFPDKETKKGLVILEKAAGYLQHLLNRKLSLHFVPKIKFLADAGLTEANRMEEILQNIKKEEG